MVRSNLLGLGFLSFAATTLAACGLINLEETADKYMYMMSSGDHSWFDNLSYELVYKENDKNASILFSVASMGLYITSNRTFYDATQCRIFTDFVVTNPEHPYVINTQLYVVDGIVETIDSVISQAGDYQFNASAYNYWSTQESWDVIPEGKRNSRQTLQAAADAYLDSLNGKSGNSTVPTGAPCSRLEGGVYTGSQNSTADMCNLRRRIPSASLTNRRYFIDETKGTVNVFGGYGGLDRTRLNQTVPDSHTFRIEDGKIRYIHMVGTCITPGCGMNLTVPP
ncbi:hypothetical protein GQ43DRAFT_442705 [Delitschia confertaspora ATCC 74209]|uniref:DUF8021 domain-containing protein n=1 Tax=Delitschia confertaspora ATCC 74209 TaxID=1513339 RepID=A0A9P4MN88_9PLEO|nr:hypothetical protein GQ43DRAFT_442705 [Delitschia confertaspora ATCC 74209]